jgi:hypothetical protein
VTTKALSLLLASAGEQSLHSAAGRVLQKAAVEPQSSHPSPEPDQTFVQTQYSSGGAGQALGPGTNIVFDDPGFGDISYNNATGVFRLLPNKKYQLTAHFCLANYGGDTNVVEIQWVDADTNVVLRPGHGAVLTPGTNTNSINAQPTADTFHQTPGLVQDVRLRVTSIAGTAEALAGACCALVKEL